MDETTIIRECQRGNFEQFTGLFDVYHKSIYNFIYYRTHHTPTAEDLTSDVFFKALERIGQFNADKGKFSTWLYQIARNTVIDHYRTHKTTNDIEDAWDITTNTDVERDIDTAAQLAQVRDFLKTLPQQQRDIVLMRVWDGLSHKEIGEILHMSEANSKMTFSRAIAKVNKNVVLAFVALILTQL